MALAFGTGTNIQLSKTVAAVTGYPISLFCWALQTSSFSGGHQLLTVGTSNGQNYVNLQWASTGKVILETEAANGTILDDTVTNATAGTLGVWYPVAGVWTSATSRVGCQGVMTPQTLSTTTETMNASWAQTQIGSQSSKGSTFWNANGSVAFPAVWNVALTTAELTMLMTGFAPDRVRPEGLVMYCRMTGTATTEPDLASITAFTVSATPPTVTTNPFIYSP